jgi:uncharacterized protein (TIGR03790 family)
MPNNSHVIIQRWIFRSLWFFYSIILLWPALASAQTLEIQLPKYRLQPEELAVVVNDQDPLSVQIGEYYLQARGIPLENLVHLSFAPGTDSINAQQFLKLRERLLENTPKSVQAYAITWAMPFKVACMSITSAITFGFDHNWCSKKLCASTQESPYYGYSGAQPYQDLGIRPTISLAAVTFKKAKALIDKGIAADGTVPKGTAYLLSTSDKHRNVRARDYVLTRYLMAGWIDTQIIRSDALKDRKDVLFYFTGKAHIEGLKSLRFHPGAIADHLTSMGGILNTQQQMSALRWLEAGASGSYGAVVEPCNRLEKFPEPRLLIEHYGQGGTLIESYWKSVQQPGEGIFIGEPLAAPFDRVLLTRSGSHLELVTRNLKPGSYQLSHAPSPIGPYRNLSYLVVKAHQEHFTLPDKGDGYYRLELQ